MLWLIVENKIDAGKSNLTDTMFATLIFKYIQNSEGLLHYCEEE